VTVKIDSSFKVTATEDASGKAAAGTDRPRTSARRAVPHRPARRAALPAASRPTPASRPAPPPAIIEFSALLEINYANNR